MFCLSAKIAYLKNIVYFKLYGVVEFTTIISTFQSWSTCPSWPALAAESDRKRTHPFGETDLQVARPPPIWHTIRQHKQKPYWRLYCIYISSTYIHSSITLFNALHDTLIYTYIYMYIHLYLKESSQLHTYKFNQCMRYIHQPFSIRYIGPHFSVG